MRDAVIVSAVRTASGKAPGGTLRYTRPDEMAATVIREALARAPGLDPAEIDDVILGCAMPEAEQGLNVARIASLRAGIPVSASALTVNRFCSSGLQAIAHGAERIMAGFADAIVAGGTESMSLVPMGGHKIAPNPILVDTYPDVYLTTGLVAENHAREAAVSREEQDAFALASHQKAIAAIDAGRFADEIVPLQVRVAANGAGAQTDHVRHRRRPAPRYVARRAREAEAGVSRRGHGHRRQLVANERRRRGGRRHVRRPCTRARHRAAGAVRGVCHRRCRTRALRHRTGAGHPQGLEDGRPHARPDRSRRAERSLRRAGDRLPARAAIDAARLNVNGGAIALGHPLGCTGAKLTATLLHEMRRRGSRYGMVTMCVGGGMGAAGIFERQPVSRRERDSASGRRLGVGPQAH